MPEKPSYEELVKRVEQLEEEIAERKRVEEKLRSSEERLFQIIQSISIPLFVIDNNHVLTHYNKALENLTGLFAHEVVGTRKQWLAFYGAERPVMVDFIVDNAPEEKLVRYYKNNNYRKSPTIPGALEAEGFFSDIGEKGRWIFFTASPLKDASGKIIGAVETLQDITERKRAEEALRESERRYKTLLDIAPYPIVVFSLTGEVYYLNPAFTEIFGWSLEELEGKKIPYVPPDLRQETSESIKKLLEEKLILRHETRRLTKDGRTLDVIMRGAIYSDKDGWPAGELVIVRDITKEKRIAQNNEAILRISIALPEYPDLEDLLDFVSNEIKGHLETEGGVVILYDEERQELFFLGAAYDDTATEKRVKEVRFSVDELIAGQVIKTKTPMIVNDMSRDPYLHEERDKKLGYHTKNLLLVPFRSVDRVIGVLCAINKKEGGFEQSDVELLNMIAGTVALSIENARFSDEIKKAYREVISLNRAKDRVINHLSHELKTPVAVLHSSLVTLAKRLDHIPEQIWKHIIERAERNLDRILEIQYEVDDIIQDRPYRTHHLLSDLLDQCTDELEALVTEEMVDGFVIERLRRRIDDLFGPKETLVSENIVLSDFVSRRIEELRPSFAHRQVEMVSSFENRLAVWIPKEVLQKVLDGLLKNAVENTPDEGKIEVSVSKKGERPLLIVHDYGVGITDDNQRRIFEGFFTTRDTMQYSSKSPFDFNAGGKGADLLRMKIFSERYHFQIEMTSSRCGFIPKDIDICPGRISRCRFCKKREDCFRSGETIFTITFSPSR